MDPKISRTGSTVNLEIGRDFDGGFTLAATAFTVALSKLVNSGKLTQAEAIEALEHAQSLAEDALDNAKGGTLN